MRLGVSEIICQVCGQNHSALDLSKFKWCDRSHLEIKYDDLQTRYQALLDASKKLAEALTFYGDLNNWYVNGKPYLKNHIVDDDISNEADKVSETKFIHYECGGKRARETLASFESFLKEQGVE